VYRNARFRQSGYRVRESDLRAEDAYFGVVLPLEFLRAISPVWPTFHLQQLVLAALGLSTCGKATVHLAVLLGVTLILTALSTRRLARVGRRRIAYWLAFSS
jgi:hypothetical protein